MTSVVATREEAGPGHRGGRGRAGRRVEWYELQRAGLALEFQASLDAALQEQAACVTSGLDRQGWCRDGLAFRHRWCQSRSASSSSRRPAASYSMRSNSRYRARLAGRAASRPGSAPRGSRRGRRRRARHSHRPWCAGRPGSSSSRKSKVLIATSLPTGAGPPAPPSSRLSALPSPKLQRCAA